MTTLLASPAPATPGRDRWTLRSEDALVVFRGRVSRFAPTVQARFTSVAGTVDEQAVDVDVEVASLTTGSQAYDQVLAAADGVVRVTATGRVDRRPFGLRLEVPGCTSLLVPQCLELQIDVTAVRG